MSLARQQDWDSQRDTPQYDSAARMGSGDTNMTNLRRIFAGTAVSFALAGCGGAVAAQAPLNASAPDVGQTSAPADTVTHDPSLHPITDAPTPATPVPNPNAVTCIVREYFYDTGHAVWYGIKPGSGGTADDASSYCDGWAHAIDQSDLHISAEVTDTTADGSFICEYPSPDYPKVVERIYAHYALEANQMCAKFHGTK